MKKLFLWVLMVGSNFWANAQVQVVVAWYYQEWSITQDSLNYKYNAGTNQLQYITDNVASNVSTTDIDNQSPNDYIYDKSGNMVADSAQSMSVSWSPYGKMLTNTKAGGASLAFGYNAMQQRVVKRVAQSGDTTRTYYIRDAQGNTMGVYTRHNDSVTWREQYIFGSSRLGLYRADTLVNKGLTQISKLYEGKRNYELTNNFGNVMAVINDRKVDTLNGTTKVGFNAVVISATDYYPFGMAIDSRSYTSSLYRYGFNGKELDKETGEQDYGMRIYDPRIAKFLSIDPLRNSYPWYSPYIFAGDNPVKFIDLDGTEEIAPTYNYIPVLGNYPKLREGEWRDVDRVKADKTFATAAAVNTKNLNYIVYQPISQIHSYYTWAAKEIAKTNSTIKFFDTAEEVTSLLGVGGAYMAPQLLTGLTDHGRKSLADVNRRLLSENMPIVREILEKGSSSLFPGNSGIMWDMQYVNREQTFLTTVISKDPLSEDDKKSINKNFANFEPLHKEYTLAKELLGVKTLDYEPQRHREAIGRSLVFLIHNKDSKFRDSEDYKKAVNFLETNYGKSNTANFLNKLYGKNKK